jgi:hypothetical protein
VQSMSIGIPEGSVREGVCIAAGGSGRRKENGVCGGAECVVGSGVE